MVRNRQLAAIMFTDIVGYTVEMGWDREKAMELLEINKTIHKPLISKYNGSLLKELGDGMMCSFKTASEAIDCAVAIQLKVSEVKDLKLRIGIHLGEIVLEGGDAFGDGVNIASRIQSIADPGGIYLSESVHNAIRGRTDILSQYLGEVQLKNVDYPFKIYSIQGDGLPVPNNSKKKGVTGRFWAELYRRGVIRAGITYILVALLINMVASMNDLSLILPDWFSYIIIIVLGGFFPLAMYFAWKYEKSPTGFIKTSSTQSWRNPFDRSQKKPFSNNVISAILVILIIGIYTYPKYMNGRMSQGTDSNLDLSIAVLPFDDFSSGGDQQYFADGVMETILNHLSKIKDLRVISRTSMTQYRKTTKSIPEIANELGVSHILEGSVQRSENKVRITTQLIHASADVHIWSEIYDRDADDILAIESEIALNIANELEVQLNSSEKQEIGELGTTNLEAYDLFLKATNETKKLHYKSLYKSIELLKISLSADPNFYQAHTLLAWNYTMLGTIYGDMHPLEARKYALPAIKKSLEINPDFSDSYLILGAINYFYEWDFKKAEENFSTAMKMGFDRPSTTYYCFCVYTIYLVWNGRFAEALELINEIKKIDPSFTHMHGDLGFIHFFNGRTDKAIESFKELLSYSENPYNLIHLGWTYIQTANYQAAIDQLEKAHSLSDLELHQIRGYLAYAYLKNGDIEKADSIIEILKDGFENNEKNIALSLAQIYCGKEDFDASFTWLEEAYKRHDFDMIRLKLNPAFKPLHSDPRWQEMMDKIGFL